MTLKKVRELPQGQLGTLRKHNLRWEKGCLRRGAAACRIRGRSEPRIQLAGSLYSLQKFFLQSKLDCPLTGHVNF